MRKIYSYIYVTDPILPKKNNLTMTLVETNLKIDLKILLGSYESLIRLIASRSKITLKLMNWIIALIVVMGKWV